MRVSDDIQEPQSIDHRLALLEQRVERLEAKFALPNQPSANEAVPPPPALAPVFAPRPRNNNEPTLEFQVGQRWFAIAGVAILTAGVAFLLSLPYASLPAAAPSLAGFGLAAALFIAGYACLGALPGLAVCLHASAMFVLGFAGLRLFYFGSVPAMNVNGIAGHAMLVAVTAVNIALATRRHSSGLTAFALAIACAIALTVGATSLVLASVTVVAVVTAIVSSRQVSPHLLLAGLSLGHATYFAWALGNPIATGSVHFVSSPSWAPGLLLALMLLLGVGPLLRGSQRDDAWSNVVAFANCALGYGAFMIHTAAAYPGHFAAFNLAAALGLIAVAIAFYVRTQSRVSTFFYAMTGYAALSLAIVKFAHAPEVFVWLSLQSVVVVATAIGFRSRFIVVANFFIFAAIVAVYVFVTKHESGISVGFGAVALITARILNWKQHRLELKTDFMRNAYLVSAFVILPYAGYHLVAARYVTLVWIALAAGYYLLHVASRNVKYRWMGHGTLVLAILFVIGIGVSRFEPVYRVLSFLVLGTTLLAVSFLFARARRRQNGNGSNP